MLNSVCLQGRLTKNIELKETPGGKNVCSFTLAVERDYVAKGQERQVDFIDCVAWNQQAVFISRYFGRGSSMIVTGELQKRSWTDSNGNNRYTTEVMVRSVNFCGGKVEKNEDAGGGDEVIDVPDIPADDGAALPFDLIG